MKKLKEKFYKALHEKNSISRKICRSFLFNLMEKLGFHIVGDHFYEPIPNLKLVSETFNGDLQKIPGHDLDLQSLSASHVARLEKFQGEFLEQTAKWGYVEKNDYFRGADALALYTLIREDEITSLVEVGQGFSTRVAAAALEKNAIESGRKSNFMTIDPYQRLPDDLTSNEHLEIERKDSPVQEVPVSEVLAKLGPNSIMFVDSSHVYKYGSDLEFLMREIYPVLPPSTILHVHDVVTPHPWPEEFLVKRKWFWNEQDFLETFLAFNHEFEVVLPVYWLCHDSDLVKEEMSRWRREHGFRLDGFSFYLRRTSKCG